MYILNCHEVCAELSTNLWCCIYGHPRNLLHLHEAVFVGLQVIRPTM